MISNCWIEAWKLRKKLGGRIVLQPTERSYLWPCKFYHAYWQSEDGKTEIEFIPKKDQLSSFPSPIFNGIHKLRSKTDG